MIERRAPGRALRLGGIALTAVLSAWAAWNGVTLTLSKLLENRDPRTAIAYWPTATAKSSLAGSLSADPKALKTKAAEIERLSREALRRSPLSPTAARALAMTAAVQGRIDVARRNIAYGEAMSRRDYVTQLWMIEDAVQRNDIPGALRHYNRVLLVAEPLRATLLPTLSSAADDPAVMRHLAPLLAQRPEWWSAFIDDYANRSRSAAGIARVIAALKLDPSNAFDRQRVIALLKRMVAIDAPREAFAAYSRLPGASSPRTGLLDGSFESETTLPPFGWQFSDAVGQSAGRLQSPEGDGRYLLSLDGSEGGEAARQLLVLEPGAYRLSARVGRVDPALTAAPFVSVSCTTGKRTLVTRDLPPGRGPQAMRADFVVPAGCNAQWLVIFGPAGGGLESESPWIDAIAMRQIR